ncbi:MAG: rRNA cytosine-C5-methyltransferase, partial [Bacteroidaceae bacterium]|nr:rRNA cytosine-C5-methyltransferase [Bacteroidaceae bacterium]
MTLNQAFIDRTELLFGKERFARFMEALGAEPVVSIRYNTCKQVPDSENVPVPWALNGRYLSTRPMFTADPLFHAGCYYVQEASSMFIERFIERYIDAPVRALDLCAAPG